MSPVRVHILGALKITTSNDESPSIPSAAHRLLALIAAAGPDGIARDDLAIELWGHPLPGTWMSALRNRVTAARKLVGQDAILNQGGRFRFADSVSVDSWNLISHATHSFDVKNNEMAFLDGEPLVDIETCDLVRTHVSHVQDARAALIQQVVGAGRTLSPRALQSLRVYQRQHQDSATVTIETIRAHVLAGATGQAALLVDNTKDHHRTSGDRELTWVNKLDELLEATAPRRRRDDNMPLSENEAESAARAEMFAAAAFEENWSLALEVAMAGLPAASKSNGDPERLALLEQIPLDKLDANRKFNYCLSMTRHLIYAGRDDEAHEWSEQTRALANSPNEELLAFIMRALVGDTADERTPIPLPEAFETAPDASVNLQSLQVAVMSHLERATAEEVAPLQRRFQALVEASADPYRRWHLLLLESMTAFVAGEVEAASTAAWQAFKYAEVFGIVDAQTALIGQLSNAQLIHAGFPSIDDYFTEFPGSSELQLGRALQAVASAKSDASAAVHEFLRTYNYKSRSFFTFPMVTLLAPHVRDPELRSALARRLQPRTSTSAIWGTGVLHLGPVDRTLALLTADKVDREVHLAAAVHVADRQHTRLWQVVTRLDLAESTGNHELRHQAEKFATTPALNQLVDEYAPRFLAET